MKENIGEVVIRDFKPKDVIDVVNIKVESFGSKAGKLYRDQPEKFKKMILEVFNKNEPNGLIVAEFNGSIIGYIKLSSKHLAIKKNRIKWFNFISKFGFFTTIGFLISYIILETSLLRKNECYISQIAISSEGRGKGIGTKLLTAGEEKCRLNNNIDYYTLHVMSENRRAYKLYKRVGFYDKKIVKFPLLKKFIGYSSAIYMEKTL